MGRGLGPVQRRLLDVLHEEPANEGMPVRKLKALARGERSNLRRGLRTLLQRRLVEEVEVEGERVVRLTFTGALRTMPHLEPEDPFAVLKARRARWAKEARDRALRRERAREEARLQTIKEPAFDEYAPRIVRRRYPGPTQRTILAVLWEYADPLDSGLPISIVKAIVRDNLGTDRSNIRRAIRTLLLRKEIEESEDGEHIRLTEKTALWFHILPPISPAPIDEKSGKAILRARWASCVVVYAGYPMDARPVCEMPLSDNPRYIVSRNPKQPWQPSVRTNLLETARSTALFLCAITQYYLNNIYTKIVQCIYC